MINDRQRILDAFYWRHGPCCAGCDWWHSISAGVGECHRAAPVSGHERYDMLGMESSSLVLSAGHPLTPRIHHCGDFKDEFDWTSLPLSYRREIGAPI